VAQALIGLGQYSTTTFTIVSASTSTVFVTCVSNTIPATLCNGRRRRAANPVLMLDKLGGDNGDFVSLDSSRNDEVEGAPESTDAETADGKIFFTVWTTSRSTTSVTVFYTNTATTVTVSIPCTAALQTIPTLGCVG